VKTEDLETLTRALSVVRQQPGRSALTVVGLAIGVGAFIAMLIFGFQPNHNHVSDEFRGQRLSVANLRLQHTKMLLVFWIEQHDTSLTRPECAKKMCKMKMGKMP